MKLGISDKTAWNWAELLFMPFVLLAVGAWLDYSQSERQILRDDRKNKLEIYSNYQKEISQLMISEVPEDKFKKVATLLTKSTLPRLSGDLKGELILFLSAAGLINKDNTIVYLADSDLSGLRLNNKIITTSLDLSGSNLADADFSNSAFKDLQIQFSDISRANFTNTIFMGVKNTHDPEHNFLDQVALLKGVGTANFDPDLTLKVHKKVFESISTGLTIKKKLVDDSSLINVLESVKINLESDISEDNSHTINEINRILLWYNSQKSDMQ